MQLQILESIMPVTQKMYKRCWKVDSRWGHGNVPSLLPVFYEEEIVFVGMVGKFASHFRDMHEGDLILIADGHWIDAIAEADTPPAQLGHFQWRNPLTAQRFNQYFTSIGENPSDILNDNVVWGARFRNVVKLQLDKRIEYKFDAAFCRVHDKNVHVWAEQTFQTRTP